MALTREQLDALVPPDGWTWATRPTLRTSGTLTRDIAHGWNYAGMKDKFQALSTWSKKHELGLKPIAARYAVVSFQYQDFYVATDFKVWANKPELWGATFGDYTCPCGRTTIHPGEMYCEECGPLRCRNCSISGTTLHNINGARRDVFRCAACSIKCTTKGCTKRVSQSGGSTTCPDCSLTFFCPLCATEQPKKGATETTQLNPHAKPVRVCARCVVLYTCTACKAFSPNERLVNQVCAMCQDKKDEEKRVGLEVFAPDELPISGNILIPSLPSRPFRTISVETEVDGDGPYLARTMYRCGLVPISRVAEYHSYPEGEDSEFIAFLKHDGSVSAGELISYLMNLDNPLHAESFMTVLRKLHSLHKMKKIAFNPNCGGHIHVDAHNFGIANVWRLLMGFGYIEDAVYRIAGAGASYGHRSLTPQTGHIYAASPVKGPFGSKSTVGQSIRQMNRMSGLNFQPFLHAIGNCACGAWAYEDSKRCSCNLGKATIEWRVFNSTDNPRILHGWIALVQALHAWADEDGDPTSDWEKEYPALAWTQRKFNVMTPEHVNSTKARLEWMHTHLPFTEAERDSLCYCITKSDMGPVLGTEYVEGLKLLPNVADFEKPKSVRNPSRRRRDIKIAPPEPGKEKPYKAGRRSPFREEYRGGGRPTQSLEDAVLAMPPMQQGYTGEIRYDTPSSEGTVPSSRGRVRLSNMSNTIRRAR